MENQPNMGNRPSNPRRRKRTNFDKFKESYLPFLIVACSVLVIMAVFIGLATGNRDPETTAATQDRDPALETEAAQLLARADQLAVCYDYDGALAVLATFSGDASKYPQIKNAVDAYTLAQSSMLAWTENVPNLSFHTLIADLDAALADKKYGSSGTEQYNTNFITVDEFSAILQRLYDNDYVLVDLYDLYEYDAEAGTYVAKELLLPAGKKPVMLTETQCNYYTYMASSHAFATKLCYADGKFYNEMTDKDGQTVTGAYDLVPVLEEFLQAHPSFSYKGARAILAFSGYDGIFGYRIDDGKDTDTAGALVDALRDTGYTIACYSYGNHSYADYSADAIRDDLKLWQANIVPVLGKTDIMVFAQKGTEIGSYDGEKFSVLYENGFRYFLGSSSVLFRDTGENYVRHARLMVTGANLAHNADWFASIFDTADLLDPRRGEIRNKQITRPPSQR